MLSLFWTKHHPNNQIATTNNAPEQLHQTATTFTSTNPTSQALPHPPFSNDAQQRPNHHGKPPTTFAFLLHNQQQHCLWTLNVGLSRTRSAFSAERVEPRVRMATFSREETDHGSFTPPFPPSNGQAWGGFALPPSACVFSVWAEMRIERGSRPLFARPMADQGGGVAPPPMAF